MVAAIAFKYPSDDDKLGILGLDMLVGARRSLSHRYCTDIVHTVCRVGV